MPNYRIVPVGKPDEAIEVRSPVPSAALHIASQKGIKEADLYDGDHYILTLRRKGAVNACWTIMTDKDRQSEACGAMTERAGASAPAA